MKEKICFIAPSGYGKSTAIELLKKSHKLVNIKIAEPLYQLQESFYKFIDCPIKGEQDGELLQFLGMKIRKENPHFMLDSFKTKLKQVENFEGIITNDDCRPPDYELLKKEGFVFVKINGFQRDRQDHSKANTKLSIEWQSDIPFDFEIDNTGTIVDYQNNLTKLLQIISEKSKEACYEQQ